MGSKRDLYGFYKGSIWGLKGIYMASIRDLYGFYTGSVRGRKGIYNMVIWFGLFGFRASQ